MVKGVVYSISKGKLPYKNPHALNMEHRTEEHILRNKLTEVWLDMGVLGVLKRGGGFLISALLGVELL